MNRVPGRPGGWGAGADIGFDLCFRGLESDWEGGIVKRAADGIGMKGRVPIIAIIAVVVGEIEHPVDAFLFNLRQDMGRPPMAGVSQRAGVGFALPDGRHGAVGTFIIVDTQTDLLEVV